MDFEDSPEWRRQLKAERQSEVKDDRDVEVYRQLYRGLSQPLDVRLPEGFPATVSSRVYRTERRERLERVAVFVMVALTLGLGIFVSYSAFSASFSSFSPILGEVPWVMLIPAVLLVIFAVSASLKAASPMPDSQR